MYRRLCERYHSGDTAVDVVGFSRGAALAVHFANVLHAHGIRNPKGRRHLTWSYDPLFGLSWRMPKVGTRRQTFRRRKSGSWDCGTPWPVSAFRSGRFATGRRADGWSARSPSTSCAASTPWRSTKSAPRSRWCGLSARKTITGTTRCGSAVCTPMSEADIPTADSRTSLRRMAAGG